VWGGWVVLFVQVPFPEEELGPVGGVAPVGVARPVAVAIRADAPGPHAPGPGAPRQRRGEWWPPDSKSEWKVAKVVSKGVHIGWGAECGCHTDAAHISDLKCKKQLTMGKSLSGEEARLRLMAWLIAGIAIPSDDGRHRHVFETKPRDLHLPSEADMVAAATAHWEAVVG
jgi:hypothetical protein